ncbi:unnamed protein product [Coffea canephora]|uniref:Uncharacterized protein n=1 Tax=Coffea canephora TaxID=49390 RepID=A0A068VG73_COFCA|nr:unnamed protein product [Coffea canephora]
MGLCIINKNTTENESPLSLSCHRPTTVSFAALSPPHLPSPPPPLPPPILPLLTPCLSSYSSSSSAFSQH